MSQPTKGPMTLREAWEAIEAAQNKLRTEHAEMRDLLLDMERTTVPDGSGNSWCPFCRTIQYRGKKSTHTPACRLGNILKKMEGV